MAPIKIVLIAIAPNKLIVSLSLVDALSTDYCIVALLSGTVPCKTAGLDFFFAYNMLMQLGNGFGIHTIRET